MSQADASCDVLVVDDNSDAAECLARLLRIRGYTVAVAHSGVGGLELALELRPRAILLDIGLPGLNGYEVAADLRARDAFNDTLIIAITGYGSAAERARSAQVGINHHLNHQPRQRPWYEEGPPEGALYVR